MTMLSKVVIKGGDEKHVNQSFVYTSLEHTLLQLHYDIFFSQTCKNLLALFWTKSLELILWFFGCNRFAPFFPCFGQCECTAERISAQRFLKFLNYFFSCYILFFLRVLELLIDEGKASFWWQQVYLFLLVQFSRQEGKKQRYIHSNYNSLERKCI